jgi:hypothetical protein
MAKKKLQTQALTLSAIEALKNKGYNQSEIAEMYGVTKQAVSYHKRKYNGRLTPREMVLEHFPWAVPTEMCQSTQYRRLRDHGEYIATGGVGMSEDQLKRLRSWYRTLRTKKWVVEFDPEIPPQPGVSNKGGFAYRGWNRTDGDLLIRVNDYTFLTEEGKRIWRFPPMDP